MRDDEADRVNDLPLPIPYTEAWMSVLQAAGTAAWSLDLPEVALPRRGLHAVCQDVHGRNLGLCRRPDAEPRPDRVRDMAEALDHHREGQGQGLSEDLVAEYMASVDAYNEEAQADLLARQNSLEPQFSLLVTPSESDFPLWMYAPPTRGWQSKPIEVPFTRRGALYMDGPPDHPTQGRRRIAPHPVTGVPRWHSKSWAEALDAAGVRTLAANSSEGARLCGFLEQVEALGDPDPDMDGALLLSCDLMGAPPSQILYFR